MMNETLALDQFFDTSTTVTSTTSPNNNGNNNNSSGGDAYSDITSRIKHAGAVHVRGMMIRRWRPRYLELDEDGVLRYYEATKDNNSMTTHLIKPPAVAKRNTTHVISNISSTINERNSNADSNSNSTEQQKANSIHLISSGGCRGGRNKNDARRQGQGQKQNNNKEFVHVSSDDIMNREMQAFSLPQQFTNNIAVESTNSACRNNKNESTDDGVGSNQKIKSNSKSYLKGTSGSSGGGCGESGNGSVSDNSSFTNPTSDLDMVSDLIYDPDNDDCQSNSKSTNDDDSNAKKDVGDNDNNINSIRNGEVIVEREQQLQQDDEDETGGIVVTHDMHVKVLNDNAQIESGEQTQQHGTEVKTMELKSNFAGKNNADTNGLENNDATEKETQEDIVSRLQVQAHRLHHHVHKHRAKAVMTILSARIIDVNSLRDIHVGLPKGSYGFVFTGRQFFSNSDNSNSSPSHHGMDGNHNDEQYDIRDDVCHPLSILSSDHDYFDTSRDYLCSVNSKEEAQQWVSALRWAANISSMRSARQRLQRGGSGLPCDPYYDDSLSDESSLDRTFSADSLSCIRTPPRASNYLSGLRRNCNLLENLLIEDDQSASTIEHISSPARSEGITIVTKVKKANLVVTGHRRILGFKFDVKYEVKMLLLRNVQLSNRSRKRRKDMDSKDGKKWTVEERTIYSSYGEFMQLVDDLLKDYSNSSSKTLTHKNTDGNKDILGVLNGARDELSHSPHLIPKSFSVLSLNTKLKSSVDSVDKVMRTLSTDSCLCNKTTLKDFLLKEKASRQPCEFPTVNSKLSALLDDNCETQKKTLHIDVGDSTDEFVKKWLFGASDKECMDTKMMAIALQNSAVEFLATAFVMLFLLQSYVVWSSYLRQRATLRMDLILAQIIFVFYLGFKAGSSRLKNVPTITSTPSNNNRGCVVDAKLGKRKNIRKSPEKSKKNRSFAVVSADTKSSDSIGVEEDVNSMSDEPALSSPLPYFSANSPSSSWSRPKDNIFKVRGKTYLTDRVKIPSDPSPFTCRGIDVWLTDNPERHIARHPSMLGGKLGEETTFIVNFLLPFGNFVTYFSVPPIEEMPTNVATVWKKFINGNQQDRDARLKLLPVVIDGPWIVKKAVGHGPALLGQAIPLQYFFTQPTGKKKGVYEVDVIITASRIAKGILNVVKSHTKRLTLAFGFIIEAAKESELPETVLCSTQIHSLHLELCPSLPKYFLEDVSEDSCD